MTNLMKCEDPYGRGFLATLTLCGKIKDQNNCFIGDIVVTEEILEELAWFLNDYSGITYLKFGNCHFLVERSEYLRFLRNLEFVTQIMARGNYMSCTRGANDLPEIETAEKSLKRNQTLYNLLVPFLKK